MNEDEYRELYREYVFGVGVTKMHPSEEGFIEWLKWRKRVEKCIENDDKIDT